MKKAPQPRSGSRVRSFIKAKQPFVSSSSPLFNEEGPFDSIPQRLVQEARKTGVLNLASRNLAQIPAKVWNLNEIQVDEKDALSVSLDSSSDQRWWEFQELQKLVIANNSIKEIPSDVERLTSLQILDAHDNSIGLIPKEIGAVQNLLKLDLSRNGIEILPGEMFNLVRLTELRLGNNRVRELPGEIGNLINLTVLELSNNQIRLLPPDIGFLSCLTTLNLAKNKLEQLPHDFCGLTGLRQLDLSENSLTDVGSLLSEFSHLEILFLHQNKLKRIPVLDNAKKLTELYMRHNQVRIFSSSSFAESRIQLIDLRENKISELEIQMDDLKLLDRCYLDNNYIETIPVDLTFLPTLKQLTLEGNPLKGIRVDILQRGSVELLKYLRSKHAAPPTSHNFNSFTNVLTKTRKSSGEGGTNFDESEVVSVDLHKLKSSGTLDITCRKLTEVPDEVFTKAAEANVGKISLSQNLLSSLPTTFETACANLRELDLDHNKFTELPAWIGLGCPHLCYLTFQNNQLQDLPKEFANLLQLREINFSYNKFKAIPSCLYELPLLEILLAQDNKIECIDVENMKRLPRLATLNLDNNNIQQCPPELGYLPLTRLSIQGNAFRIPAYHILAKGTEATMAYLRNRIVPPN